MIHRLVWNFEFTPEKNSDLSEMLNSKEEQLKWEARFFWTEKEIIRLTLIDNSLLELTNYQYKQKEDYYFLLPKEEYNIKSRRGDLLYKPLLKKTKHAASFGTKINLSEWYKTPPQNEECKLDVPLIMQQLQQSGIKILVKKESFTYKFPIQPLVRLELSRIEINQKIYFSVCVEGKSRQLIERMSKRLVNKQSSCDYVSFLKKRIKK